MTLQRHNGQVFAVVMDEVKLTFEIGYLSLKTNDLTFIGFGFSQMPQRIGLRNNESLHGIGRNAVRLDGNNLCLDGNDVTHLQSLSLCPSRS